MLINSKDDFELVISEKTKLYKHIIDSTKPKIEINDVYTTIDIIKNKKMLLEIQQYFIGVEEYEYAEKIKQLLNEK